MSRFKPQFFTDVTEIRQDMTGLTGSGKLILSFRTPQIEFDEDGNGDEMDIETRNNFYGHINNLVDEMNRLSYRLKDEPEEPVVDDSLLDCDGCGRTVPGDQLSANGLCPECVKE